jgi:hypothetical protein
MRNDSRYEMMVGAGAEETAETGRLKTLEMANEVRFGKRRRKIERRRKPVSFRNGPEQVFHLPDPDRLEHLATILVGMRKIAEEILHL